MFNWVTKYVMIMPYLALNWPQTCPIDPLWLEALTKPQTNNVYMWNFGSTQEVAYNHSLDQVIDCDLNQPLQDQGWPKTINIDYVQIFQTQPGHNRTIHSDGRGEPGERDWAINWVDPMLKDHWMIWYDPRDPDRKPHVEMTHAGTPYISWRLADCREIARVRIQGYYLVNTTIPHTVTNKGTERRVAISLRCRNGAKISYHELYELLKDADSGPR